MSRHLCHHLVEDVSCGKNSNLGAPGMSGWQILVMIVMRLNQDLTFDDIEVMFNNDRLIRQFLEIDYYDLRTKFSSDTLQCN